MPQDHESFMKVALGEAEKCKAEGNVAVGSIVVRGDAIVARGRNLVTSTSDPTAHAETVALREAGAAEGQGDFSGCTLYTTFEPCPMCCGAIMISGISTLVMGGRSEGSARRWGDYSVESLLALARVEDKLNVVTGVLTKECNEMIAE